MYDNNLDYFDVIIVGTGAAGLFTALSFPSEYRILMITKDKTENSDSYLAQGGISALLNDRDYREYYEDTMKAGHYENNPEAVREMIIHSGEVIEKLIGYGVSFDRNKEGEIDYTREGGHSKFRILHHKDITGREIVTKLLKKVKNRTNIKILENTMMIDIIKQENQCYGIVSYQNKAIKPCYSKFVVLATGGIGGAFKNSTNFPHITGDSFAIALRHGIDLENINYIQIHPTVLFSQKKGRKFLISESVRGEGAILLNEEGERFVDELLPRDIVTEEIRKQMEKFHTDHVYLSLEKLHNKEIKKHFPNIYERCLEEGYDVMQDPIPVAPAQHYLMGGIRTNTAGETSVQYLYAVGETACNGVHGKNRLASNSLLESLVFAQNTARSIHEKEKSVVVKFIPIDKRKYQNIEEWQSSSVQIVLDEIKRKDRDFYDKWCNA